MSTDERDRRVELSHFAYATAKRALEKVREQALEDLEENDDQQVSPEAERCDDALAEIVDAWNSGEPAEGSIMDQIDLDPETGGDGS